MFKNINSILESIAKDDLRDDIKNSYEAEPAWPATRRYSHEEWTLFFDIFQRGIFEQNHAKQAAKIFLVYPAREERGFKLARKFFENKFKSKYKYETIWTQLKLKNDNNGSAQASFEEKIVKLIAQEASKGELHFMLLISIKEHQKEEIRGNELKATIELYRKIAKMISLYQKNHPTSFENNRPIQFNLRILVADLLQAYNQLPRNITADRFNDEIDHKLSGYWAQNGQRWIDDVRPSFDWLRNELEAAGITLNINFTPWVEILREAKTTYPEFETHLVDLENFSSNSNQLNTPFSQAVNFKAHYHYFLFAEDGKKIYSELLSKKITEYHKQYNENDLNIIKKVTTANEELNKQNTSSLKETQNIIGYSQQDWESGESLLEKCLSLLNKKTKDIEQVPVSRRSNRVPSRRPNLVLRKKLLREINEKLKISSQDTAPHKLLCLHGIGGAGKTTLAILYQHWKERSAYASTVWIEGRTAKSNKSNPFEKYIEEFTSQLGLPNNTEQEYRASCKAIRKSMYNFLHAKKKPLLIIMDDISFESLEEEHSFHQFLLDILPYPDVHVTFMDNPTDVPQTSGTLEKTTVSAFSTFAQTSNVSENGEDEENDMIHPPMSEEEQKYFSMNNYVYRCVKCPQGWRVFTFVQQSWQEEIFQINSDILRLLIGKTVTDALIIAEEIKHHLAQRLMMNIPGCRILLTSRSRLEFQLVNKHLPVVMMEVSGMESDEARSFLSSNTQISQAVINHVQKIAEKFGFLPLIVSLLKDNLLTMETHKVSKLLSSDMLNLATEESTLENMFWKFVKNIELNFDDSEMTEEDLRQVRTKSKRFIKDVLYACSFVSTNSIRLTLLNDWFNRYYMSTRDSYKLSAYSNSEKIFNAIKRESIKKSLLSWDEKNDTISMHMVIQELFLHKLKNEENEYIDNIIQSLVTFIVCLSKSGANKYQLNADKEVLLSVIKYVSTETLAKNIVDFFDSQLSSSVLSRENYEYICEANSLLGHGVDIANSAWRIEIESRRLAINKKIFSNGYVHIAYNGLKNIAEKLCYENLEEVIKELFIYYYPTSSFSLFENVEEIIKMLNSRFKNTSFSEKLKAEIKRKVSVEIKLHYLINKKYFNTSVLFIKLYPDLNYTAPDGKNLIAYIVFEAKNIDLTKQILYSTNFSDEIKENCLKISSSELQPNSANAGYLYYTTLTQLDNNNKTADFHHNYACYCAATGHLTEAKKHIEMALQQEECASSFAVYAIILIRSSMNIIDEIKIALDKARSFSYDADIDFQTLPELLDKTLTEEMQYLKVFKIPPWLLATWQLIRLNHQQANISLALQMLEELKNYSHHNPDKKLPMALLAHAAYLLKEQDLLITTIEAIRDPSDSLCLCLPFDTETSYAISRKYGLKSQYFRGFPYLKKAALDGYLYAIVLCAACYALNTLIWDLAVRRDKLLFWSKKVSDSLQTLHKRAYNDAEAQYALGMSYFSGLGLPIDYYKAFSLCMKASEQGHVPALHFVGYSFDFGRGVTQSDEKANYYYKLAAAKNNATSQRNLYFNLEKQNFSAALKYLKKSAHSGNPLSQYKLAQHLSKNQAEITLEIFNLYQQAAENQHELAQLKMAEFYENGVIVEKNPKMAEIFYKKADSTLTEAERVYKVKGIDKKRNAWYYILVDTRSVHKFFRALGDEIMHLENHGKILDSGYGDEPPQSVTDVIKKKYDIKDDDTMLIHYSPYTSYSSLYSFFCDSTGINRKFTQETYLINHRHDHPKLQQLYDQRFGLTILPRP